MYIGTINIVETKKKSYHQYLIDMNSLKIRTNIIKKKGKTKLPKTQQVHFNTQ